ncbi:MAG: hypothetical protein ABJA50_05315 [Chloroflexota bacterium]
MNDPINPANSPAHTGAGLRWAVAIVASLCVVATLYLVLPKAWPRSNTQANDIIGRDGTLSHDNAYTDRWIAVDLINRPDAGPFDITELTITGEKGSIALEMRGQEVDEVRNGNWAQTSCPSGCLLGIAYATLVGNTLATSVETAPGLTHQLTLKVKASSPGSDALLTVVDTVMLGGKALASSTREFVSNGLIHPERMMDTGLPKLR